MKHRLISYLVLVVAVVFVFTGCTKIWPSDLPVETPEASAPAAETPDEQETICLEFDGYTGYTAFEEMSEDYYDDDEVDFFLNNVDYDYIANGVRSREDMLAVREYMNSIPVPLVWDSDPVGPMDPEYMAVTFYGGISNENAGLVYYSFAKGQGTIDVLMYNKEISAMSLENDIHGDKTGSYERIDTANEDISELWHLKEPVVGDVAFAVVADDYLFEITADGITAEYMLEWINAAYFTDMSDVTAVFHSNVSDYLSEIMLAGTTPGEGYGEEAKVWVSTGGDTVEAYPHYVMGYVWNGEAIVYYENDLLYKALPVLKEEGKIPRIKYAGNIEISGGSSVEVGRYIDLYDENFQDYMMDYVDIYNMPELSKGIYYAAMHGNLTGDYIEETDEWETEMVQYVVELVVE